MSTAVPLGLAAPRQRGRAVAAIVCALVVSAASIQSAGAATAAPPLVRVVADAARRYSVPAALLFAIGYVDTHWRMHVRPGLDGGWGVMGLAGRKLERAARLARLPLKAVRRSEAANVRAGAALLARLVGAKRLRRLGGWFAAVARFGAGRRYAEQVFTTLREGASARVDGRPLVLAPENVPPLRALDVTRALGGADYPSALWAPASRANYAAAQRPYSSPITRIVIHSTESSYASAIRWFQNPAARASAHYVIRSSDGQVTQMVHNNDVAWHAGNREFNATAIGIEHEAFTSDCSWYTGAMYRSSARLVAYLALRYGIPINRLHVIGHNEVPDPNHPGQFGGASHHTDPGRCWDWNGYMTRVATDAASGMSSLQLGTAVVDTAAGGSVSAPGWQRSSASAQRYGQSYAVSTGGLSPARFRLSLRTGGDFQLYGWWPSGANRPAAAQVTVQTTAGPRSLLLDERRNGGTWVYLGSFPLAKGSGWDVSFAPAAPAGGAVVADAIKVATPIPVFQSDLVAASAGWQLDTAGLWWSDDAGGSWRTVTPPGLSPFAIRGVRFNDSENGSLVALGGANESVLALYRTSDGGAHWTSTPLPTPANLDAGGPVKLDVLDQAHIYVLVPLAQRANGIGQAELLRSQDSGVHWNATNVPAATGIAFSDPSDGWLTGPAGALYRSRDGGASWHAFSPLRPKGWTRAGAAATQPRFSDANNGVLPVTLTTARRSAVAFETTTDGGHSWTVAALVRSPLPSPTLVGLPVAMIDANNWVVALPGNKRLVLVQNAGKKQQQVSVRGLPNGNGETITSLSFSSPSTGWAELAGACSIVGCSSRPTLYRTSDGGATWSPAAVSAPPEHRSLSAAHAQPRARRQGRVGVDKLGQRVDP